MYMYIHFPGGGGAEFCGICILWFIFPFSTEVNGYYWCTVYRKCMPASLPVQEQLYYCQGF